MRLFNQWRLVAATSIALAVAAPVLFGACGGDDDSGGDGTPQSSQGAKFLISPDRGQPDTKIHLSACGLDPNATVTIEASDLGSFPEFTTDASGAFNLDTQVPSIAPGTFIVRVSTSDTVFAETVFEIEQQGSGTRGSPTPQFSPEIAQC